MYYSFFQNKVVDVEGTKVKLQVSILNIFLKFLYLFTYGKMFSLKQLFKKKRT